ncbi:MAG: DUF169 domain-containing protein, partial [Terriglobales bacterium]
MGSRAATAGASPSAATTVICPLAAIAFGFHRPNDEYLKGFAAVGMYCKDEEAAASLEASTWKFKPGTYDYVCVAPLNRT